MSFWTTIRKAILPDTADNLEARSHRLNVRCNRCGEVIPVRIDLLNDISPDYASGQYVVRKTVVGNGANRCFERIEVTVYFDKNKRLLSQEAVMGEIVEPEE
ncbi:MAG: hypothetical protein J5I90_11640 [Caldilineales bacterium]|nr:hypothetical protein [Caldilineales bacterium]